MSELRSGSIEAAGKLIERFYPELRRLASGRMAAERGNHTWQPTILVHELYMELANIKQLPPALTGDQDERKAFFGLSAFLMKRLLTRHARPLPNRVSKTELDEAIDLASNGEERLREIEDMLSRLAAIDPTLRVVVEMRAFEGLSREEIAGRLGCSVRTVARHWEFAKRWLQHAMAPPSP
jgi:RNA polymerase sigma factor (TIGR02999 family)